MRIQSSKFKNDIRRMIKSLDKIPMQLSKELKQESLDTFINNDWPPKVDGSKCTLIKTGKMKSSIKSSYSNNSTSVYDGVEYGKYHQYGTDKLPVRKFILDDEKKIVNIVEVLINKIIK